MFIGKVTACSGSVAVVIHGAPPLVAKAPSPAVAGAPRFSRSTVAAVTAPANSAVERSAAPSPCEVAVTVAV